MMSTAKMAVPMLEVASIDGQGQFEPGSSGLGIHADAAQLSPKTGDHKGQHPRQGDQQNAKCEFDPVGAQVGGNSSKLAESVPIELALFGGWSVRVLWSLG